MSEAILTAFVLGWIFSGEVPLMTIDKIFVALLVFLHLAGTGSLAKATGITQAGFNDATGINSNPTPNSPYTLNGSILGAGVGELGWAGPWFGIGGDTNVQTSTVFEGDGALQITPTFAPARQWTAQLQGQLTIEQYVRFTEGARLVAYTQQNTTEDTTVQGPIWQAFPDHHFNVIDGIGDGGDPVPTVTDFTWQSNVWYKITVHANVATQTWDFAVNDVPYISPHPLGYRGTPTALTTVRYLSEGSGLVFLDAVTVIPEPSSLVLAAFGLAGLVAWGWRRHTS
jgi:hypothetical protein